MKEKDIKTYLASEEGQMNAKRFIKALREKRIIATVKKVSSSGMSRDIFFGEVAISGKGGSRYTHIYQFNWFFKQLGYNYNSGMDSIRVGGCGMDMIFNTLYGVCGTLKYNGFKLPDNWSSLSEAYLYI